MFALVALSFFALPVSALGLGELQVLSALNERLDARIDLRGVRDVDLEDLRVSLAGPEVFEQAGMARGAAVMGLRFEVTQSASGGFIRVTSRDLLREPALGFVVEVTWRSGHLLKEYSVLLSVR